MKIVRSTLILMFKDKGKQILLGLKKRGFGKEKWNGFGGKIEQNETIKQAAVREVKEECNLDVKEIDLNLIGLQHFSMIDLDLFLEVSVLKTDMFSGDLQESEEMSPKWFGIKDIPYNKMWKDDSFWLPLVLSNNMFYAQFKFQDTSTILNHDIKKINNVSEFKQFYVQGDHV